MKTIVRPATHDDIDALMDMAVLMHAESPRFATLRLSIEKVRNLWVMLIDMPNALVMVADRDGVLIGGMAAVACEHWLSDEMVSTDYGVFVRQEYRGDMTAARLVNEYIKWASRQGVKPGWIQLGVSTGVHQEETAAFYQRMGFMQYSIGLGV